MVCAIGDNSNEVGHSVILSTKKELKKRIEQNEINGDVIILSATASTNGQNNYVIKYNSGPTSIASSVKFVLHFFSPPKMRKLIIIYVQKMLDLPAT